MNSPLPSPVLLRTVLVFLVVASSSILIRGFSDDDDYFSDSESEEPEGAIDGFNNFTDACGLAINLGTKKYIEIASPGSSSFHSYNDSLTCKYYIIGTAKCIPRVRCSKMDMRVSKGCEKEHLRISDGAGGEVRHCSKQDFQTRLLWQASKGHRDLYVDFKSGTTKELGSSRGKEGFRCSFRCWTPRKGPVPAGEDVVNLLPYKGKTKKIIACSCGYQNKEDRIVGGEDVKLDEFPWHAALVAPKTRKPFCGASLISDRFLLTAAHCFFFISAKPSDFEVLFHAQLLDFKMNAEGKELGSKGAKHTKWGETGSIQGPGWNLAKKTDEDERSLRLKVKRIIMHPLFNSFYDFDACLLELVTPLNLRSPEVPTPVCLPPLGIYNNFYTGAKATVIGWGKGIENAGSNNRLLQKLEIPILNFTICNETMPFNLTHRMLCAGYFEGGKDACTGDSGGPLIHKAKNMKQYQQIGIVSWGEGCARVERPGMYARVTEFLQWIHYETVEADTRWCKGLDPKAVTNAATGR